MEHIQKGFIAIINVGNCTWSSDRRAVRLELIPEVRESSLSLGGVAIRTALLCKMLFSVFNF